VWWGAQVWHGARLCSACLRRPTRVKGIAAGRAATAAAQCTKAQPSRDTPQNPIFWKNWPRPENHRTAAGALFRGGPLPRHPSAAGPPSIADSAKPGTARKSGGSFLPISSGIWVCENSPIMIIIGLFSPRPRISAVAAKETPSPSHPRNGGAGFWRTKPPRRISAQLYGRKGDFLHEGQRSSVRPSNSRHFGKTAKRNTPFSASEFIGL
jgi:hypothetical protein